MKFCTNCGRQLNDNEVCTCTQSTAPQTDEQNPPVYQNTQGFNPANQAQYPYGQQGQNPYVQPQNTYAQQGQNPYAQPQNPYVQQGQNPYAQPQNPYVQQGQNPYAQPQNPYGQSPRQPSQFQAQAKNIFSNLVEVIKAYFKSPAKAMELVSKNGSMSVPGILAAIYAIATFLCTWLSFRSIIAPIYKAAKVYSDELKFSDIASKIYSVPMLIFAGILSAAVLALILICFRFVVCKIFGSDKGDFKSGFVTFAVYSIPSSALLLIGAILSFISFKAALLFSALAFIYILVSIISNTAALNAQQLTSAKWLLAIPAIVAVVITLNYLLGINILKICLSDEMKDSVDKIFESLGDIQNLM